MGLFGTKSENVAILDVRSSSIGAGYVSLGAAPALVYATRMPLEAHATEPFREALTRTLDLVLSDLTRTGAPLLRGATGNGHIRRVVVSVSAPWQQSRVMSTHIEEEHPFVFTRQTLEKAVVKGIEEVKGMERVSDMVLATLLNGYEVDSPFGKKVNRAELILLTSSVETDLMESVTSAVRKALHQHHITFSAFLPSAYAVIRDLYPHQRDFVLLDIGSEATEVLLAKHGILVSLTSMPHGTNDMTRAAQSSGLSSPAVLDLAKSVEPTASTPQDVWLRDIAASLGAVAKQEPLPRTVFLLAEEHMRDFLRGLLDAPQLRTLWLSEEPLSILPILPGQFATFLGEKSVNPADPALALLALASAKRW